MSGVVEVYGTLVRSTDCDAGAMSCCMCVVAGPRECVKTIGGSAVSSSDDVETEEVEAECPK